MSEPAKVVNIRRERKLAAKRTHRRETILEVLTNFALDLGYLSGKAVFTEKEMLQALVVKFQHVVRTLQ